MVNRLRCGSPFVGYRLGQMIVLNHTLTPARWSQTNPRLPLFQRFDDLAMGLQFFSLRQIDLHFTGHYLHWVKFVYILQN